MLEADERPGKNLEQELRDELRAIEEDLWERDTLDVVLRSISKSLDDLADYEGVIGPVPRLTQAPLVAFAPALIYRRRSVRGKVAAFTKTLEELENGGEIPPAVSKLCERTEAIPRTERTGEAETPRLDDDEIYFPLPANREQRSIVEKLRHDTGLLVQGPPGTGKSHTIANLICHLLATGKRVLVTAQTPQALSVLKDKVPNELQAMCVTVLGHDRESVSQLQSSVRCIGDRQATWDEYLANKEIHESQQRLKTLREQLALVDRELEKMRRSEVESQVLSVGSYEGTATTIAQQIKQKEAIFAWFTDDIALEQEFPLQHDEFRELILGLRSIDKQRSQEFQQVLPDLASPGSSVEDLIALIRKERDLESKRESIILSGVASGYRSILHSSASRRQIQDLHRSVKELRQGISAVESKTTGWITRCMRDVLSGEERPWKELLNTSEKKIAGLASRARAISETHIVISVECERTKLQADASDLKSYLESGGKLGTFSKFLNATVKRTKYVSSAVSVEGRPCQNVDALDSLLKLIELERTIDFIWNMWKGTSERVEGPISLQIARLEEHLETLTETLALEDLLESAKDVVLSIRGVHQAAWHDAESRENLFQSCQAVIANILCEDAGKAIDQIASHVREAASRENAHVACESLLDAIERRDEAVVIKIGDEISNLQRDKALYEKCQQTLGIVAQVAPKLAGHVKVTAHEAEWEERILVFDTVWRWAQAQTWLKKFIADQSIEGLTKKHEELSKQVSETIEKLATTKAWSHCIGRLSEPHRQNLVAWQHAIRRIGAGTGRHAERHRRAAQKHLAECQEAIPAWVMPMYRLYETIDPRPGMFDVVIVDEASQCGIDGLFLLYLGKQVVIVGDDEQISPTNITNHDSFQYLVNQALSGYHLSSVLQPETSLFDLGEVYFRNRIVLREHFRCMPEIIRFSNNLCYAQTPLIPLRQYPADRVPPVKAVYVPNGCVSGSGPRRTNPQEARALVDSVVACCQDVRYAEKTMGIISLLGDGQARLIENELIERLGPEEIEKRRLLSGDPYSFQGDERDIMFLSLVVAPIDSHGERSRPTAITKKNFKQRYNVAASRARDQMWLFHSVSLDELRNPEDLRRKLVEYCTNPEKPPEEIGDTDIEELRLLAAKSERPQGSQPSDFDSWFEVDVFLQLYSRGYRVIPQFPTRVDNYRIDLVVEGDKPKLAIECDGDHWHGPERFHADAERQRKLERAGWTFWRVRSSEYYHNPDAALESLWQQLDRLGIRPTQDDRSAGDNGLAAEQPECDSVLDIDRRAEAVDHDLEEGRILLGDGKSKTQTDESEHEEGSETDCRDVHWQPRDLEHPEETSLSEIANVLVEIIQAEGPIVDNQAFKIYARAAGIQRLRRPVKEKLNKALEKANRDGLIERRKECGLVVIWRDGAPDVLVRARGNRILQEVPPSEIAVHIREILVEQPLLSDGEIVDGLRERLSIGRVTKGTRSFLLNVRKELVADC